jgi:hypothetical protein
MTARCSRRGLLRMMAADTGPVAVETLRGHMQPGGGLRASAEPPGRLDAGRAE